MIILLVLAILGFISYFGGKTKKKIMVLVGALMIWASLLEPGLRNHTNESLIFGLVRLAGIGFCFYGLMSPNEKFGG